MAGLLLFVAFHRQAVRPISASDMPALRSNLCAFTVLCLILTSQTMAVARGAQGPAGQMVLCTGNGPITVLSDANGQPTGPVHICPDCALGLFDTLSTSLGDVQRTSISFAISGTPSDVRVVSLTQLSFHARGPPSWV